MGLRSALRKAISGPAAAELALADARTSMNTAGMDTVTPFSPGQPLQPFDGYSTTPRTRQFVAGYNIAARPRTHERMSFDALRGLVDAYDVAQMCIWHRIDSLRSLDWNLTAKPRYSGDVDGAIELGENVLAKPDHELPFKAWLAKFVYDILAFDAGCLYRMRNVAGQTIGLRVIDGTTIAPLLDDWGNRPAGDAPAFVQFNQGIVWDWLTGSDLVYVPMRPTSTSMYGKAPLETILLNANTDLRTQQYFLQKFTDGNIPEGFATAPEGWTATQILDFQELWDATMYGDQARKHQIRFVPHDMGFAWSNEKDFSDEFSLHLMRKTAAAFHVTPNDLGFTEDVNRATGDTQVDVQFRVGDLPLIQHVAGILTSFLQDDLGLPLVFNFDTGQEKEDRLATAQADQIYIQNGVVSVSEVRERIYGLSEPEGGVVPRFIETPRAGPIPLSALFAVAGEIDQETGAPLPGAPLPHKPFAPVEGVAPQKPPDQPPLAVQRYPADNATSVQAAAEAADAPVTKERAAFTRFAKARRKAGVWRDFSFEHVPAGEADRLNADGRASVVKAGDADPKASSAWRDLPQHAFQDRLVEYHAAKIRAALKGAVSDEGLRDAVSRFGG